ncbi:oxygenase MpaB family protein, partial [Solirubrobacter soli]|uniref:oxygenase MpaB family protein n=1 Tax=Solirubrobacter soli TaxID=363832 RepID=UPI00041A83BD
MRDHWQRRIAELDPDVDYAEIYRIMGAHEFPWDVTQALGLALYRTYAVPSIGQLLSRTREFEDRTHKRYADTGLILEAVLEHGFGSADGRSAIRRMNQMHGSYPISNDDMRYVLCTFVVVPLRWLDRFGWRAPTEAERRASANYYRELGRHMNIKDRPETHEEFAAVLDEYEREHFAYSPGGRAVSDATLSLLLSFYPRPLRPLLRRGTMALLDQPLREAFAYPPPDRVTSALTVAGLRARAAVERRLPPRMEPKYVRDLPEFAIYPNGYRVEELGTFPR